MKTNLERCPDIPLYATTASLQEVGFRKCYLALSRRCIWGNKFRSSLEVDLFSAIYVLIYVGVQRLSRDCQSQNNERSAWMHTWLNRALTIGHCWLTAVISEPIWWTCSTKRLGIYKPFWWLEIGLDLEKDYLTVKNNFSGSLALIHSENSKRKYMQYKSSRRNRE